MRPNIDEALRYLGVPAPAPLELRERAEVAAQRLAAVRPRWIYRVFPLSPGNGGFALSGTNIILTGNTAQTMLAQCGSAAVLVCTLGAQFDALLRTEQVRDMSDAVILDACGSALVEAGCDAAEGELLARLPGKYLTDRFSPGYGDLTLTLQPSLCTLVNAERRLGVTVAESLLMNPSKSVTAIIGISDSPQMARVRGCAYCSMRETCQLRKGGKNCAL